jgi:hypothetical protein
VTSMVLGILGVVCCTPCAPVAWYVAHQEILAIRAGASPPAGEGWAAAGRILGIVGTGFLLLTVAGGMIWFFLLGGALSFPAPPFR